MELIPVQQFLAEKIIEQHTGKTMQELRQLTVLGDIKRALWLSLFPGKPDLMLRYLDYSLHRNDVTFSLLPDGQKIKRLPSWKEVAFNVCNSTRDNKLLANLYWRKP